MRRLKVQLMPGWQQTANPDGPPTFVRGRADDGNPLQISYARYLRGEVPNLSEEALIQLSIAQAKNLGDVIRTDSGVCAFGRYGMACFRSGEFHFSQVWHLSDGQDFIFVTYICGEQPCQEELTEVELIVKKLGLRASEKKWWQFWR